MHGESLNLMKEFVEEYGLQNARVVDVGSYNVNGTYRDLFSEAAEYVGVDIIPGPNVDVIMDSPEWEALLPVDAVICGQTVEHCADIPKLMKSMFDVLKPGGLLCVIVPSEGPPHDYPIWVGNFSKEQMAELVEAPGFEIVRHTVNDFGVFKDNCCVARKPEVTMTLKGEKIKGTGSFKMGKDAEGYERRLAEGSI